MALVSCPGGGGLSGGHPDVQPCCLFETCVVTLSSGEAWGWLQDTPEHAQSLCFSCRLDPARPVIHSARLLFKPVPGTKQQKSGEQETGCAKPDWALSSGSCPWVPSR